MKNLRKFFVIKNKQTSLINKCRDNKRKMTLLTPTTDRVNILVKGLLVVLIFFYSFPYTFKDHDKAET